MKQLLTLLAIFFIMPLYSQGVKWISIEEAQKLNKITPRKIIIDVYTDWCGWCKRMDNDTYKDPKIVKYINDNYYAVKFNAEQQTPVSFNGKKFEFVNQGARGYNTFAATILNNQMGYPSTAFINEDLSIIGAVSGYKGVAEFEPLLYYIKEEHFKKNISLQDYTKGFGKPKN